MMTRELERRLAEATELAKKNRHEFVTLEHLLLCLTESAPTSEILTECQVNVPKLRKDLQKYIKENAIKITDEQIETYGGFSSWNPEFTLACHRLLQRAALQMKNAGRQQINEGTLLIAFYYEQDSYAVYAMAQQGLSQFDLINYVSHGSIDSMGGLGVDEDLASLESHLDSKTDSKKEKSSEKETKKSSLESFCTNLNQKALDGKIDPLIGREDIVNRLVQTLARRTKNNPLLIGDPGVGKTAIVEGLALKITQGEIPEPLQKKIIYSLDLGTLLAGTKFRGDFEGRLKGIISEAKNNPHIILFIDEIHTLVGAGSTSGGSMDASNLLKPSLTKNEMSCIGSTTQSEYRQYFEKDRALNRRFQKIDVNEPSIEESIKILTGLKSQFEQFHRVHYTQESLIAAVDLSQKHIHGKLLPDKAIDVVDEAGAYFRLKSSTDSIIKIDSAEIEEVIAKLTNLPVSSVSSSEKSQLKDLENKLKARVFGQDEAIDKLVSAIKLSRSGLGKAEKPIGSFLFAGPTGVGKTEVSKQLAEILGIKFLRFDMSEYMEKHTVARLIGAPPGYVGFEQGGLLTEQITQYPHCVLLFDEIEKSHTDINNILLQVMDAGRLTDSNGRVTDFKNVVLILTSNAGALEVSRGSIGWVEESRSHFSMEAIKKAFSPEFINRLDGVVTFKNLSEPIVIKIVEKLINELKMTLATKKVEFSLTKEALNWLAKKGYSPIYGARPLARAVEEHIKKPLVDELLFGQLVEGGIVEVGVKNEILDFNIRPLAQGH